jgi:hypothetical protein
MHGGAEPFSFQRKAIATYSWLYAEGVVPVSSDVSNADLVLLEHMD